MLGLIVAAVLPDRPDIAPDLRREAGQSAVAFVANALKRAPLHLRLAERCARLVIFTCLLPAILTTRLDRKAGAYPRLVLTFFERATNASANVIRLYRSLAIFAFYEHPHMVTKLGSVTSEARQQTFRQKFKTTLIAGN